nr:phage tail tape measure protein [uncultured Dethiosulfovibrio sp.]
MNLNEIWIKIKVNIDEASKNIGEFGKKLDSFGNKAVAIGNSMSKVADPMMGGLMKGVSAVTAGIGGIAAAALKVGGDFEHAMLMVQGVAGATEAQFKQMSDAAAKLGEDLPISATAAAEAMYSLASAGLSTEEILSSVQDVAAISIAQNYDLASSAEMVVGAMSVYGLAAEQAGRITDAFANATKSSQLNMEKMKYALAGAGKDAARLGLDLEQTLAALGVLADTNMDGSTMGTGLKSVLLSLLSPTEDLARLFRKIGYEAVDADGKLKPLEETFRVLREAGISSADAVAFFGKEASGVADVLINNADKMTRLEEVMRTTGSAQALLENQMKSLKNHLKGLSSALEQSLIITFNGIKKETKELVNTGIEAVKAFNGWAEQTDVVAKSIVGFSEGLGLASVSADSFAESLKKISVDDVVKKFEGIGEGIAKIGKGFSDLNEHIPWGVLIDNIEGIGLAIIGFWSLAKVTAIIGNIAIFGGALANLWTGTLVPLAAWMVANPFAVTLMTTAGALIWLGKQLWDCADAWFKWGKARREAQLAEERANEFEGISKDYVDAVKGSADALDKLPPKYRELAEASIKAKKDMMEQIKGMGGEKTDVLLEIMQEYPEAFRLIWTAVAEEADKGMAMLPEKLRARYMEAFKEMEWVQRKLAENKDMFSNPEDLQNEWASRQAGKTRQSISEVDYAIARVQDRLKEIKVQGAQAMESFGLSTAEAGAIMKEELLKTVTEFKDGLEKESPYMATAFVNALEKMGKEGGDAMMNAVTNALKDKKDAPVDVLTGAIKQGLIKGPALKEAMGIIKKRAEEMAEEASKAIEAQFSGYSPELLKALKIFQSSNALGQVGIETKFKPAAPGASVKNISNPVSVQIGTVNVGKPEDAKKTGQSIGEGISRSFYPSY